MKIIQPQNWPAPKGYANGVSASGRMVFVAGQIGWNERNELVGTDFVDQTKQALQNIVAVLAAAGAKPEHLVRLNWYVVDKEEYRRRGKEIGDVYRSVLGKHFPAMALLEVKGLLEPGAVVEIEATAVVP